MPNKVYLNYECELAGATMEQLLVEETKEILRKQGVTEGVLYEGNNNLVLIGCITADTKTETKCQYKILKEEWKRLFNIKKTIDKHIEEGYFS